MAASLTCVMEKGRLLIVGHVGDCRVIRIREGRTERLTTDHRRGTDPLVLSAPGASQGNDPTAVTRAIGLGESLAPDVCVEGLREKDGLLVATAGLTAIADEQAILATVQRGRNARHVVNELIQYALARGAPDNLTCIYARWQSIVP
jgi:protein phosphatase